MEEKRMFIEDDETFGEIEFKEKQFQKLIRDPTANELEITDIINQRIEEGLMYRIK